VEVPHRSLVRRLERKYFAGSQTWASPQDVPAAAAFEFGDVDDDPHTSLWDDGPAKESWREALLSILLARSSLGALDVTTLWQDQLAQCGSRIHETPGDTRFKCDLSLHFELLGETYASDYIEMALAAARRNDFCSFTEPQVVEVLEDAFYDKLFEWADLDEGSLKKNLKKKLELRNIGPKDARARLGSTQFIDGRTSRGPDKIADAIEIDVAAEVAKPVPVLSGIRTNRPAILYCEDGQRSRVMARSLRPRYQIVVLEGGYSGWLAASLPTVPRPIP